MMNADSQNTADLRHNIAVKVVKGDAIRPYIPDLARLRVQVFRDFPYLYDGSDAYERDYLQTYLRSDESLIALALHEDRVVGASSGMPLAEETEEVKQPFRDKGIPLEKVFYFGESVLLKPYRGLGLGKRFFAEREAHALKHGYEITSFCAVQRPENHPLKPASYRPLDDFWHNQGYKKQPEMCTGFSWLDVGEEKESSKEMVFWVKYQ